MKKHTLFIYVAALLTMLGAVQPLSAQQKQDALYIFRNDGGFDAFFYADIERIAYSHIDTLGVAHDEIVVQEIYALDTLFRIPLNAIDSVAFVTPENVYKPDVICPDKSMTDYIVESDSVSWFRLSADTPAEVIPKVGDKLLIEEPVEYLPRGFSGIVTKVDLSALGYTVTTEALRLDELFDRYVAKASGGAPDAEEPSNARMRGLSDFGRVDPIDISYQTKDTIDFPTFTYPFIPSFNQEYNLVNAFNDNLSVDLVGTVSGSMSYTPTIKSFQTFLYWDVVQGLKTGMHLTIGHKSETKITLSGALNAKLQIPFTFVNDFVKSTAKEILKDSGKKLSKLIGKFNVDWGFGFFIGGSGTISASIYKEENSTSALYMNLMKSNFDMMGSLIPITADDIIYRKSYVAERDTFGVNGWGAELALSLGFYASAEAKLPFIRGSEVEISAGVEAGVKLSNSSPVKISDMATIPLLDTGKLYAILNREAETSVGIYGAFEAKALVGHSSVSYPLDVTLAKTATWSYVPNVSGIRWDVDKKTPWRGDLVSWWDGKLLWPMDIGFAIFDTSPDLEKPEQVADYISEAFYFNTPDKWSKTFEELLPGRFYTAYPQIKLWGGSMLTDKSVEFTLGPPNINPDKDYLEFDEGFGSDSTNVRTNVANTEFKTDAKWLNLYWYNEIGRLDFTCDRLPDIGEDIRKADVIGIGYDKDGNEIARDTIKVAQLRPTIGSRYAEFDAKASTKTIKVFTTVTNMEYSFAKTADNNPDNFCSFNVVNDSTLIITVRENKGSKRTAVIDAKGTSLGGKYASGFVTVIQEGTKEEKPDTTTYQNVFTGGYIQLTTYFDNGKYTVLTAGEEKPDIGGLVSVDGDKLIYNYSKSSTFERDTSYNVKNDAGKLVYKEGKIQCNYTETIRLVLLPDSGNNVSQYVVESGHVTYDRIDIYENKNVYMRNWLYDLNDLKVDVCSGYIEFSTDGNWFDNENDTDHITNFSWASTSEGQLSLSKAAYLRLDLYTPKDYPLLSVHENYLEFDNMGQLLDYNRKFIHSNLSDLKVTSSDEWIKVKILDAEEEDISQHYEDALSFDLDYNDAETERSGFICVQGTTNDGQIIKRYIRIKQQANDVHGEGGESATLPTDDILNELKNYMPIYTGSTPPNLDDKTIDMSPLTVCYDSDGETSVGASGIVFSFGHWLSQGNATLDVKHYPYVGGKSFAVSEHTYQIQGSGQNFTLGYVLSWEIEGSEYIPEQKHSMSTVISGTLTSKGFENLYMATISSEQVNNQEPERSITILKDTDGLSIPTIWNPGDALFDEDDDED